MDDAAFTPGAPETELERHTTTLVIAKGHTKRGTATLTNDRIRLGEPRTRANLGGMGMVQRMQQLVGEPPPTLELELRDVTGVERATKAMNKDRLVIHAAGRSHLFTNGYARWAPLLERVLSERHGLDVVDRTADGFRTVERRRTPAPPPPPTTLWSGDDH